MIMDITITWPQVELSFFPKLDIKTDGKQVISQTITSDQYEQLGFFILGARLPGAGGFGRHENNPVVLSSDRKSLYTIGSVTQQKSWNSREDAIFKFSCETNVASCEWKDTGLRLKEDRQGAEAFLISDELAEKICNLEGAEKN